MTRKQILLTSVLVLLLAILSLGGGALAQTSPNFNLEWHVIGGGGQPVSSARYIVSSTIGQGAASSVYLSGEHYVVGGGFWAGEGLIRPYGVYLPLLTRNSP